MQAVCTPPSPHYLHTQQHGKIHLIFSEEFTFDSLQFMSSSFEKLVTNLAKDRESHFRNLKCHITNDKIPLLLRKGV